MEEKDCMCVNWNMCRCGSSEERPWAQSEKNDRLAHNCVHPEACDICTGIGGGTKKES